MISQTIVPIQEIHAARLRLERFVFHTPLVRFEAPGTPAEIYLKLENLQPGGSFKLRGAGNAVLSLDQEQMAKGVWTASAGNMGQALAWWASKMKIPCTVVVPENTPKVKMNKITSLGSRLWKVPFPDYQQIQQERHCPGMNAILIHPFADPAVMAGNGTIGLEILEDLPDVEAVVVPYGGGGLSCGIAAVIKTIKPNVKIYAAEVNTGAPLTASFSRGKPVEVDYQHSFVNGIGAPFVFPEMWEMASKILDGSMSVSPDQIAETIRMLVVYNRVIAEGAGAVATAVALRGQIGNGKIACVVSGGNIDNQTLIRILEGKKPGS